MRGHRHISDINRLLWAFYFVFIRACTARTVRDQTVQDRPDGPRFLLDWTIQGRSRTGLGPRSVVLFDRRTVQTVRDCRFSGNVSHFCSIGPEITYTSPSIAVSYVFWWSGPPAGPQDHGLRPSGLSGWSKNRTVLRSERS